MTRQQDQKRQGRITDFLAVRRKTVPADAATPGTARVIPQRKVTDGASLSARTSKKAKLRRPSDGDQKQVTPLHAPALDVSGWKRTTAPSAKSTPSVRERALLCKGAAPTRREAAVRNPSKRAEQAPLCIPNPPVTPGDGPQLASTPLSGSSPVVAHGAGVTIQQPESENTPQVAGANNVADAATAAAPPRPSASPPAYEKYRRLLRKRKASSPASSDDEIHVPPAPTSSAAVPAPAASTVTLQGAPDSRAKPVRVPGYIRYRHLVRQTAKLKLPDKFEVLEHIFAALDQTLVFNQGQGHSSIFVKIKKSVENLSKRSFELRHLAQILHIFPEAYTAKAVRCLDNGEYVNTVGLEINYGFGGRPPGVDVPDTGPAYLQASFVVSQMEKRKLILHDRLLTLMKAEHEIFLAKRSFQLDDPGGPLRQWHPDFDVDSVPDVSESELPRVELFKRSSSGRLVLRSGKTAASAAALRDNDDQNKPDGNTVDCTAPSTRQKTPDVPATVQETQTAQAAKGESGRSPANAAGDGRPIAPGGTSRGSFKTTGLLERIRAKEKSRVRDTMYGRTAEQVHKRAIFSRLPDIIDSISFYFSSNRKTVMHLKDVVKMLMDSLRVPLSESEVTEHIDLLHEIAPDWISLSALDTYHAVGSGPKLVELNRGAMTVNGVKERCMAYKAKSLSGA